MKSNKNINDRYHWKNYIGNTKKALNTNSQPSQGSILSESSEEILGPIEEAAIPGSKLLEQVHGSQETLIDGGDSFFSGEKVEYMHNG
jgi:hypothetical protein